MAKHRPLLDQQKSRVRNLRHDATCPERLLWGQLRSGRLAGFKFRRQHPLNPYVLDFYCHHARLAIELDGDSHADRSQYDGARTTHLNQQGIEVLRIANDDVLKDTDAVLEMILKTCRERSD